MKLLALETSTETMSIALGEVKADGRMQVVASHEGPGGAQSSAALLPAVSGLLVEAGWSLDQLAAIVFGEGPGSFTGLRTACSVAQGLALGAELPVLPIDTLMAVAEQAWQTAGLPLADRGATIEVLAAMDARMGETYFGLYTRHATAASSWSHDAVQLAAPQDITFTGSPILLAGNARAAHADRLPAALLALPHVDCLPTAAALLRLAPTLLAAGGAVDPALAIPRYVRDKVAKTTQERQAERDAGLQPGQAR